MKDQEDTHFVFNTFKETDRMLSNATNTLANNTRTVSKATDIYEEHNMAKFNNVDSIAQLTFDEGSNASVYKKQQGHQAHVPRKKGNNIRSNSFNEREQHQDTISCWVKMFSCGRTNIIERNTTQKVKKVGQKDVQF